jgi:hypothetical protein
MKLLHVQSDKQRSDEESYNRKKSDRSVFANLLARCMMNSFGAISFKKKLEESVYIPFVPFVYKCREVQGVNDHLSL